METRIFLDRYRLSLGRDDLPVELHRTPAIVTYRGQDVETGREVALDLVTVDTSEPEMRERLTAEAKRAQEINNIHLLSLYDFGFDRDQMVYVTEYFEGYTAAAWVAARGPLPTAVVLRIALQVTSAIGATAFYRIYHHALNPDNLLFGSGPAAQVGCPQVKVPHWFGVTPPKGRSVSGAPDDAMRYASPEQLSSGLVDVRSEIYSLGCMMWFLLTGVPPVGAQSDPPEGRSLLPAEELLGVRKIVSQLISLMLDPDPEKRPHDPIALVASLQTCLDQVERRSRGGSAAASPTAAVTRKATASSSAKIWGVAAATVAGIALTTAFVLPPRYLAGMAAPFRHSAKSDIASHSTPARPLVDDSDDSIVEVPHRQSVRQPLPVVDENPPPPEEGPSARAPVASSPLVATTEPGRTPEVSASAAESSPAADSAVNAERGQEATDQAVAVASTAPAIEKPAVLEEQIAAEHPVVAREGEPTAAAEVSEAPLAVATPPPAIASAPVASSEREASEQLPASSDQRLAMAAPPRPASEEPTLEPIVSEPAGKPEVPAKSEENTPPPKLTNRSDDRKTATAAKGTVSDKLEHKTESKVARKSQARRKPHEKNPTVKRAKLIPRLRFGSKPAELVGTTRDGRWILSVGTGGRRVVVQPPPGFGGR
ncbi:MAG: protein kinase [Chthoniobacterales bacterium]